MGGLFGLVECSGWLGVWHGQNVLVGTLFGLVGSDG